MRNSTLMCKQVWPNLLPFRNLSLQKDKVVVVMGVTGAGKSRLSIELATQFRGEVINSDKIQVYKGLDIATNKITHEERCGVLHHLLGVIDPYDEFTASNFCDFASSAVTSITDRRKLPIIVGGSNSFIDALVRHNLYRYDCCFLWVDVSMNILNSFLYQRVDKMVDKGMINEVRNMFDPSNSDYSKGIRKAIGVPEFDRYFRAELSNSADKYKLLEEAINQVKINNCILASKQLVKIKRLKNVEGWKIQKLDATEVFRKQRNAVEEEKVEETWKNLVMEHSIRIVEKFLCENNNNNNNNNYYRSTSMIYNCDGTTNSRAATSVMATASHY